MSFLFFIHNQYFALINNNLIFLVSRAYGAENTPIKPLRAAVVGEQLANYADQFILQG